MNPSQELVTFKRLRAGYILFLPLPPSTNARTIPVRRRGHVEQILTKQARGYLDTIGQALALWQRVTRFPPIDEYRYLDVWILRPRSNADGHNYLKMTCDVLQRGGLVTDDKYLITRIQGQPAFPEGPEVAVQL